LEGAKHEGLQQQILNASALMQKIRDDGREWIMAGAKKLVGIII
jgi:hypothetical protein